jgi:hypothetical protein
MGSVSRVFKKYLFFNCPQQMHSPCVFASYSSEGTSPGALPSVGHFLQSPALRDRGGRRAVEVSISLAAAVQALSS